MKKLFLWSVAFFMVLQACTLDSEYDRLVKREMATGERYDSLILGTYFGMEAEAFYDHCWELNKKKIVKEGPGNSSVEYRLDDGELNLEGAVYFYPRFYERKIYEMPMVFTYNGWAPWNKQVSSDSLLPNVLHLLENWYGGEFIKLEHPKKGELYVQVQGNRRIKVGKKDERQVVAEFTDLTKEAEKKAADAKKSEQEETGD